MLFKILNQFSIRVDAVVDGLGRCSAWLVLVVILLLFGQLPLREIVGGGHILANDFGQIVHAIVFMTGVSFALRWDRHVRMDVFYRRFSARTQAFVNLAGSLLCVLPWCVLMIVFGWTIMLRSVAALEKFPDTWSPGYFVFKVLLVASLALVALQALSIAARAILVIVGASRAAEPPA